MTSTITPALFIGHGSPENVVLDNRFTRHLQYCGQQLVKPKAILMISAHWLTHGTFITTASHPKQVFDFYGFAKNLYQVNYQAKTSHSLVEQLLGLKIGIIDDEQAGFDHGTWTILKHLFPQADVPVVQLSLNSQFNRQQHLAFAQKLQALRSAGVMIIGSGNVVHNLRLLNWQQREQGANWAKTFDLQIKTALNNHDTAFLSQENATMSAEAKLAIPTEEHYWPLLYIEGVRTALDNMTWIDEGYEYGSISLRSYLLSASTNILTNSF